MNEAVAKILTLMLAAMLFASSAAVAEQNPVHEADRFGHPKQGQLIVRNGFLMGYSGWHRSALWTLHRVSADEPKVERTDEFREDPKVPVEFRATLADYRGAKNGEGVGLDRGHLVPSNDLRGSLVDNSDSFFLSNMSPQLGPFNRNKWRFAEKTVHDLVAMEGVREVYVMSGPIIMPDETGKAVVEFFGKSSIPIPTHYFKSILVVGNKGRLRSWGVIMPNKTDDADASEYQVTIDEIEKAAGLDLWPMLADDVEAKLESKLEAWRL